MNPSIENSILIPKSQIKDYYNFLFYDGIYIDEQYKFTAGGLPNMGQKKAFFAFYITGTRYNKNLKIQANEGAFISNVFVSANDSVLIPFSSIGGKYGLSIYIFFWVQLPNEQVFEACKRIELHNYFTGGGPVKLKDLFFEAEKQDSEDLDTATEAKSDNKKEKIIQMNVQTDYVENKGKKYKITLYDSGNFDIFNITTNKTLKPSPMANRIFKLSKFDTSEKE